MNEAKSWEYNPDTPEQIEVDEDLKSLKKINNRLGIKTDE